MNKLTGLQFTHKCTCVGFVLPTLGESSRFLLADPSEFTTKRTYTLIIHSETTYTCQTSPKQQRNVACKQTGHVFSVSKETNIKHMYTYNS